MEKELNTNNSKKIIIGISLLFCTVILIIGTTLAFFTQSDTKDIGNIVSINQVSIGYDDSNNDYMLKDLIPTSEEYAIRGYEREGEFKCKDDSGYNICSVYRFTITNNAEVSQKLIVDMTPTLNTFHNLKFMLYEVNGNITNKKGNTFSLTVNDKTPINIDNDLTLNPNESKTYELVYYILNLPDTNQNELDAGKNFGAKISVNSLTTGTYISNQEGATCWKTESLEDGTNNYKLTEFYGIDNSSNEITKITPGCEEYVTIDDTDNTFKVKIPNHYGNDKITTIGYNLFFMFSLNSETQNAILKNYYKIKQFDIQEGITAIEDGPGGEMDEDGKIGSSFWGLGIKGGNMIGNEVYVDNVVVNLSSTLTYIGANAFSSARIQNITLPSNLKFIGEGAFEGCNLESINIPYSVTTIGDSAFNGHYDNPTLKLLTFDGSLTDRIESGDNKNLLTIGKYAFNQHDLTYLGTTEDDYLKLPARVDSIGDDAFGGDSGNGNNLQFIRYMGSREKLDTFGTSWYRTGVTVKAYGE